MDFSLADKGTFFINKSLDYLVGSSCDLINGALGLGEDDFNPDLPLATFYDEFNNSKAGFAYSVSGLCACTSLFVFGFLSFLEYGDMFYHFGDLKEMGKDAGTMALDLAVAGFSLRFAKKASENLGNIQRKRRNGS